MQRIPEEGNRRIVVLGGSFDTGKTTIFEQIQKDFGERYRYIPDHTKKNMEAEPLCHYDIDIMREVYRRSIIDHVVDEMNNDGRLTIADGSLIDIAARSQFVLDTNDFVWLNRHLMERDEKGMYAYLKFPLIIAPDAPDGQQRANYHHRIDRTLRLNRGVRVEKISKHLEEFTARYARVLLLVRHYERLMLGGTSR